MFYKILNLEEEKTRSEKRLQPPSIPNVLKPPTPFLTSELFSIHPWAWLSGALPSGAQMKNYSSESDVKWQAHPFSQAQQNRTDYSLIECPMPSRALKLPTTEWLTNIVLTKLLNFLFQ